MSIAGGEPVGISSAPWQVEIFAEVSKEKTIACGGAVLDPTRVLTAAHCVYDPETDTPFPASAFVIVAGTGSVSAEEIKSNPAVQARFVTDARVHPDFSYASGPGAPDDVAVLALASPLSLDSTVGSIALAQAGASLVEGAGVTLTGFGEQQYDVEGSHDLYSLSMTAGFAETCGGEADAVFVCARSQAGSGCSGDSGSALTSGFPAELVGVMDTVQEVSGEYCQAGSTNGFVNTSAPEIRDFIEGSETPPMAPRGGKGVAFQGEGKEAAQAKMGTPLTCEPGAWGGSPTISYAFVDSANGIVLQSGSSPTYTPTAEDVGRRIYCEVQASNAGGTGAARTATARAVYDPAANETPSAPTLSGMEWFPVAAMSEPRADQTSTLLADGDVLVAGGYNGFSPAGGSHVSLRSAEVFDPATGEWTQTGQMLVGRSGQVASLLPDGDVLVVGGWEMPKGGEYVRTAELYDPASNTWTAAPVPAELEESQSLTALPNGMLLLRGVFGTELFNQTAGAAIYDPSSNKWTRVASPKLLRYGATATLLPNGDVLMIGGSHSEPAPFPVDQIDTLLASVEEYDPATDTWSEVAPMAHARMNEAVTLMTNGEVLVAGGTYEVNSGENDEWDSLRNTESYNPATNRWSARAPTLLPRAQDTATLMPNGDVLIAGGYDCGGGAGCLGSGGSGDCCGASSAEVYDPAANTWEFTDPVLSGNEHTATLLPDGGVLVTGGNVGPVSGYEMSSAEIYAVQPQPQAQPQPPASSVPQAAAPAPPSLTRLSQSHTRWREGRAIAQVSDTRAETRTRKETRIGHAREAVGTTFMFVLNEPATVTFTFTEELSGRRQRRKCLAPSRTDRRARACTRSVVRGTLTFAGRPGENTVRFQGRISRTAKLPPGNYTMHVAAIDAAGKRGVAANELRFSVFGQTS
ncbi:MAG TPA: kelch repeat-containing protein [Solirubrobacteraceae bacterium]|nr:kelch repeat-containing protein [Solirubrobacteraceae bacterium]